MASAAHVSVALGTIQDTPVQSEEADFSAYLAEYPTAFPQFSSLPDDVCVRMLSFVDDSTLEKCRVVCRRFFWSCQSDDLALRIARDMAPRALRHLLEETLDQDGALPQIMKAFIKLGDFASAMATYEKIPDAEVDSDEGDSPKGKAGVELWTAMLAQGDAYSLDELRCIVESSRSNSVFVSKFYVECAFRQQKNGEMEEAQRNFAIADRFISISLVLDNEEGFAHNLWLAERFLKEGDLERAKRSIKGLMTTCEEIVQDEYFRFESWQSDGFGKLLRFLAEDEVDELDEEFGQFSEKFIGIFFDRFEDEKTYEWRREDNLIPIFSLIHTELSCRHFERVDRWMERLRTWAVALAADDRKRYSSPSQDCLFRVYKECCADPKLYDKAGDLVATLGPKAQVWGWGSFPRAKVQIALAGLKIQLGELDEAQQLIEEAFKAVVLSFQPDEGTEAPSHGLATRSETDFASLCIAVLGRMSNQENFDRAVKVAEQCGDETHFDVLVGQALGLAKATEGLDRERYLREAQKFIAQSYDHMKSSLRLKFAAALREMHLSAEASTDALDQALQDEPYSWTFEGINSPAFLQAVITRAFSTLTDPNKRALWVTSAIQALLLYEDSLTLDVGVLKV